MDLSNELKLLNSNGIDNTIEYIKRQKDLWDKKMHIFNVLAVVNELEKWKTEKVFDMFQIQEVYLYSTQLNEDKKLVRFNLNWNDGKNHYHDMPDFHPYYQNLDKLLKEFNIYNLKYSNDSFKLYITANDKMKEKILDVMLSNDLKVSFEYNELHSELENGKENINKKFKL
jgi:hypothetical protein